MYIVKERTWILQFIKFLSELEDHLCGGASFQLTIDVSRFLFGGFCIVKLLGKGLYQYYK